MVNILKGVDAPEWSMALEFQAFGREGIFVHLLLTADYIPSRVYYNTDILYNASFARLKTISLKHSTRFLPFEKSSSERAVRTANT